MSQRHRLRPCDMKKLSDEKKKNATRQNFNIDEDANCQTDVWQEKLEEKEINTLTEIKQTNMQLIAVKFESEKEAALAEEASQNSVRFSLSLCQT